MAAVLEEIGTAIGGIAEQVGPSVVGIGRVWGVGSGVVVAEGGLLPFIVITDGAKKEGDLCGSAVAAIPQRSPGVAGDDAATLGTWIDELFRLIVCVE